MVRYPSAEALGYDLPSLRDCISGDLRQRRDPNLVLQQTLKRLTTRALSGIGADQHVRVF